MTCGSNCQQSRKDRCRCSCNGVHHGSQNAEFTDDHIPGEMEMAGSMGGEITDLFEKLKDKKFLCLGPCNQPLSATDLTGYPHDAGFVDGNGKKWWVYVKCPNKKCGYATAVWKIIQNRIAAYERTVLA